MSPRSNEEAALARKRAMRRIKSHKKKKEADKEKVKEAFKLILQDDKVKAILVNIFGGIVRCDLIAEGVVAAADELGSGGPLVVRLQGTNAEEGRAILAQSGLDITPAETLQEAGERAVAAASGTAKAD